MKLLALSGVLAALTCVPAMAQANAQANAQTNAQSKPEPSTADSVYTREQASRGQDAYAGYCRSCHTAESHTGPTFVGTWNGKTLADLVGFLRERMPKNEPGSLSDQEYVDLVAYLLQMNNLPPGARELPVDSVPLKAIRIQLKP